jgi:hypothetical protein
VFLIAEAINPNIPLSEEETVAFFVLLASYAIGEFFEGSRIEDSFYKLVRSHKFQMLVAGFVALGLRQYFPEISDEIVREFVAILALTIGGSGIAQFSPLLAKE